MYQVNSILWCYRICCWSKMTHKPHFPRNYHKMKYINFHFGREDKCIIQHRLLNFQLKQKINMNLLLNSTTLLHCCIFQIRISSHTNCHQNINHIWFRASWHALFVFRQLRARLDTYYHSLRYLIKIALIQWA